MSTTDGSLYAVPIVNECGHGLRASGVGADFLINASLAAGTVSRVGIAIGVLLPARASSFVQKLRELEEALTQLSHTAGVIGEQASVLQRQVADATAQREACSTHVQCLHTVEAAAAPAPYD